MTQLELAFRSGAVYRYVGVPAWIYHQLLCSESKGKYFNAHIRNRYVGVKMPDRQASVE